MKAVKKKPAAKKEKLSVKLHDSSVLNEARKLCVDVEEGIGEYVTNAVKLRNGMVKKLL